MGWQLSLSSKNNGRNALHTPEKAGKRLQIVEAYGKGNLFYALVAVAQFATGLHGYAPVDISQWSLGALPRKEIAQGLGRLE